MSVYDFTVKDNKGNDVSLSDYKGKVLLIVNTATKCGLTPQYEGLEKIKVNGRDTAPFYKYLKDQKPGRIQWNFAKFLIDKDGNVVDRFAPSEKPETLVSSIEAQLGI